MSKPILYSSKACKPCEQIKDWFKERNIEWEEGDLGQMFLRTGNMGGLPIVEWGGIIISGYRAPLLQKIYEKYNEKNKA